MLTWITHDVEFACGNLRKCLARLDNGQKWLVSDVDMSTHAFRNLVRRFAQRVDAQMVEIRYMYDGVGQVAREENLIRLSEYGGKRGYDFPRMMRCYGG